MPGVKMFFVKTLLREDSLTGRPACLRFWVQTKQAGTGDGRLKQNRSNQVKTKQRQ